MNCRHCGAPVIYGYKQKPSARSVGLNEDVRQRVCSVDPSHKWLTVEIDAAELADLRRRAYLYERTVGSATGVA